MTKRLQEKYWQEKYSVMIFVTIQDSGSLNIFGQNHIPLLCLDQVNKKKQKF